MTPHDLLGHFEVLADAPNGIQRLRELVLELAVRGKLVEQDPADEPASVLLMRIKALKSKTMNAARGRTAKSIPPLSHDECPFEIPGSWEWTRSAEIGIVNPRNVGNDHDMAAFLPMTLISTDYRASIYPEVRPWKDIKKGYTHIADSDIAVAKITPCFENGKAAVFANLPGGYGAGTTELHVLRPVPNTIAPYYFLLFFKSPTFVNAGIATMTGTAGQQRVSGDYFALRPIPLPPATEQHRIVARVDELMALLDRLEAKRSEREAARSAARDSALAALREAPSQDDVEVAWLRVRDHFHDLFATPEDIAPLRKTILQLAVSGRLVVQFPGDTPGLALLDQIQKIRTNGSSYNRKRKLLSQTKVIEPPFPFAAPRNWAWARLGDVVSECRNGLSTTPNDNSEGFKMLRISAATSNSRWKVNIIDYRWVNTGVDQVEQYRIQLGDILACRFNGNLRYVGKASHVSHVESEPILYPDKLIRIRPILLDSSFLCLALNAGNSRSQIEAFAVTTAGNLGINGSQLQSIVIPIPPLPEQVRIRDTANSLFDFCDHMESSLRLSLGIHNSVPAAAIHHLDL